MDLDRCRQTFTLNHRDNHTECKYDEDKASHYSDKINHIEYKPRGNHP